MPVRATYNTRDIKRRIRKAAMRGVTIVTEDIRTEMIDLILYTEKTGRLYFRRGISVLSKSGKSFTGGHQASAPGEAPASDTGFLVGSIVTKYALRSLTGTVVVGAEYGPYLEYGTEKMEPRPFARPARAAHEGRLGPVVEAEIAAELAGN